MKSKIGLTILFIASINCASSSPRLRNIGHDAKDIFNVYVCKCTGVFISPGTNYGPGIGYKKQEFGLVDGEIGWSGREGAAFPVGFQSYKQFEFSDAKKLELENHYNSRIRRGKDERYFTTGVWVGLYYGFGFEFNYVELFDFMFGLIGLDMKKDDVYEF